MQKTYLQIIELLKERAVVLREKLGSAEDIGVKKQYVTEQDFAIERELKVLVQKNHPDHFFYGEEENDEAVVFTDNSVWVVDPISGTEAFVSGIPSYAMVVSHVVDGQPVFAIIYDPSQDMMFVAEAGKGAICNGEKISVSDGSNEYVVFNVTRGKSTEEPARSLFGALSAYCLYRPRASHGLNAAHMAMGRYAGCVTQSKDVFPLFAASLMIREAGGIFTTHDGREMFTEKDCFFVAARDQKLHKELRDLVNQCIS